VTTIDELKHLIAQRALATARDPRPRAIIRVGAIGHRNITDDVCDKITHTVREILNQIRQSAEEALKKTEISEQFTEGLELVVISPLAEGADRLIAHAGIDLNYRLGAILPFDILDYEATFDLGNKDTAVDDFHTLLDAAKLPDGHGIIILDGDTTEGKPRDAAFMRCANTVTRWSDILIAILSEDRWNSQTGQSVRGAIDMGVPVIVIDPKESGYFTLHINAEVTGPSSCEQGERLGQLVVSLLAPSVNPAHTSGEPVGVESSFGLAAYRSEHVDCDLSRACDFEYSGPYLAKTSAPAWAKCWLGLNKSIEKHIAGLPTKPNSWNNNGPFVWDLPFDRTTAAPIIDLYLRYHRADVVANAYGELQRSVQIIIAILGVATVTFAALSALTVKYSTTFSSLELVSLAIALNYVWVSHRQAWLDRWLDCRLLAEIFRYSKFLLLTGLASPFAELRGPYAAEDSERTWARDHAQSVLRAHRLSVPGRGSAAAKDAVGLIANYIAAQCIEGQARYHYKTGHFRLKYGKALKTLGVVASIATLVLVGAKAVLAFLLSYQAIPLSPMIALCRNVGTVLAVVFPALTAGLLAMRAIGEHDVVGLRSLAMMKALEREKQIVKNAPSMQALGDHMLRIARTLLHDVAGWRELYSEKHLES